LSFLLVRCAVDELPHEEPSTGAEAGAATGGASEAGQGGTATGGEDIGGKGGSGTAGSQSSGGDDAGGASSGGDDAGGAGGESGPGSKVTGRVINAMQAPVEGTLIRIGSTSVSTDADGLFEIENVQPRYDLVLVEREEKYAHVYRGLTTRRPVLLGAVATEWRFANIQGVVSGGTSFPAPTDRQILVDYFGPNGAKPYVEEEPYAGNVTTGAYWMRTIWSSVDRIEGSLAAIEFQVGSSGRVIAYDGFGVKLLATTNDGSYGALDGSTPETTIALEPIGTKTLTGNVSVPSGYRGALGLEVGSMYIGGFTVATGPYSLVVPSGIAELPVVVYASLQQDDNCYRRYVISESTSTLDFDACEPPKLVLPADGAVGPIFETNFTWTKAADAVGTLALSIDGWFVLVTTSRTSERIPSLSADGVSIGYASSGSWWVRSDYGLSTVDEWVQSGAEFRNAEGRSVSRSMTAGL
jgi:hypothetical protein